MPKREIDDSIWEHWGAGKAWKIVPELIAAGFCMANMTLGQFRMPESSGGIWLVIAGAVCEEILTRYFLIHVILTSLLRTNKEIPLSMDAAAAPKRDPAECRIQAIAYSSILFGAMHLVNLKGGSAIWTLLQCIYTTLLGIMFGIMYFRRGRLNGCIIWHILINLSGALYPAL